MVGFKSLTSKRIPTLIGLLVLVVGLGAGLYLVGTATIIPRASAEETPKEIKITNVSENGFTVSWITEIATTGFIRYGTESNHLDQTLSDDRDQLSGSVDPFLTHHVTVRNLQPETTYYFKLGSGTRRVLFDNNGKPYEQKTFGVLGTPPPADTVYGTVVTVEGVGAEGALVYVRLPGAKPLSAIAKSSGNWAVSLSTARTEDGSAYATYDRQSTTLELFVQAGNGKTASAVTVTANDAPVPPIILGKSHDFRSDVPIVEDQEATSGALPPGADLSGDKLADATEASDSSSQFATDPLGEDKPKTSTFTLDILNPEMEGEKLTTVKPEIFGTSPKNVTLSIVVESTPKYTDEIEVGADGLWQWTPPANLTPGEHTVTISYTDSNGILQQVKRKFVVAAAAGPAAAGLPAFEATPSGSASPSASPKASAPPRVSMPATDSGVPVAGVLTPTLLLVILGAALLSAGIFWQLRLQTKLT